jgi:CRP-like cAMP-binding protein
MGKTRCLLSMTESARPNNRILSLVPEAEYQRLAAALEPARLPLRAVWCEAGEQIPHVHFPLTNVISAVLLLEDGTPVEATTIGNEGAAGVGAMLGAEQPSAYRLIQQVEGDSLRIPADEFRRLLAEFDGLRELLLRYVFSLLHQAAQNAACNLHHRVEERMARWLLASADRAGRDEFELTQELLSQMLGVRRQTVNLTAGVLQQAGIITYRWGRLKVLDRAALEQTACECYRITKETSARIMQAPS